MAAWRMIINVSRPSSCPKTLWKSNRCPEVEIGKKSVTPCSIARNMASKIVMRDGFLSCVPPGNSFRSIPHQKGEVQFCSRAHACHHNKGAFIGTHCSIDALCCDCCHNRGSSDCYDDAYFVKNGCPIDHSAGPSLSSLYSVSVSPVLLYSSVDSPSILITSNSSPPIVIVSGISR